MTNSFKDQSSNSKKRGSLESLLHSKHTATVEKMAVGGSGVCRITLNDGKNLVVFVPNTVPGDSIELEITSVEKNFAHGEIVSILKPSSHRRSPPCLYANDCGGCSWQQITDEQQIVQKELILTDLLKQFIPQTPYILSPTIHTAETLGYRNRIQLKQLGSDLGYFKKESHDIVPIDTCLIAEPIIQDYLKNLKALIKPAKDLKKIEILIDQKSNSASHKNIGSHGEGLAFSQVNRFINEKLVQTTLDIVKKINPDFISELYCGSGNFTFPIIEQQIKLKPHFKLEGVELNSLLTAVAVEHIKVQKWIKTATVFTTTSENFCKIRPLSKDLILLDPPRSGCSDDVVDSLIKASSKNILYISCHPVQFARDMKKITTAILDYQIKHLQIFDMFPQTDHFETLCWISKDK